MKKILTVAIMFTGMSMFAASYQAKIMLKNLVITAAVFCCAFNIYADNGDAKSGAALISGEVFPVDLQKGIYHINENFPGILIFRFNAVSAQLKNPRIVLDMPDGYSCLGAYPYFPNSPSNWTWQAEKMTTEAVTREQKPYTRYIIYLNNYMVQELKPNVAPDQIDPLNIPYNPHHERVYIKTSSKTAAEGKKEAFWKLATDGWEGQETKFKLVLLPELILATPKVNKFGVMVSSLKSLTVPDDNIRGAYLNYWKSITDKPYIMLNNWPYLNADQVKIAIDNFRVIRMLASNLGGTPMLNAKEWYAKKGVNPPLMILNSGKIANDNVFTMQLCPGFLAKDSSYWNDFVAPEIKREAAMFKTSNPEDTYKYGIMYDIEPGAKHICYCDNCRSDFKVFAKLDKVPSTVEIEKQYSAEWFNFRVRQSADIVAQFCKCVKKNFTVPAIVCTDPLHVSGLQQWCGLDISLSDKDADLLMPMPYYCGLDYFKDVELNVKKLKTPNFPLNDPSEDAFFDRYTPDKVKQNIVASAALGCVGFGLYPSDVLDGKYLTQIKSAFAIVAQAEDYYFAKRNDGIASVKTEKYFEKNVKDEKRSISVELPVFNDTLQWLAHQKGDNVLVTLFNYNADYDAIVTMSIPGIANGNYKVRELDADSLLCYDDNKPLGNEEIKNGFLVKIPRDAVKVIEISKAAMTCQGGNILQKEVSAELANLKQKFQENYSFKEIKQDNAEITWGVTKDAKTPQLKLISDKRKMYINIENGASIVSWGEKNKDNNDLLFYKQRGALGDLILSNDKLGKGNYLFTLDKLFIAEDGSPVAKLVYTVPPELNASASIDTGLMEGLKIEKQIALENKGNTVKIKYTFTNNNSLRKDIALGFRIKNLPKPGGSLVNEDLSKITQISFDSSEGQKVIKDDIADNDNYMLAEGCAPASFFKVKPKPFKWTISPVKVLAGIGKFSEQMIFTPDSKNTAGFYVWWSKYSGYTIEFISKETLLKFGESISSEYSVTLQ